MKMCINNVCLKYYKHNNSTYIIYIIYHNTEVYTNILLCKNFRTVWWKYIYYIPIQRVEYNINFDTNSPSLFIADWKHLLSRQALHWFLWVLSMGHLPLSSPCALHVYTRFRWMLLLKNPEQPAAQYTQWHLSVPNC